MQKNRIAQKYGNNMLYNQMPRHIFESMTNVDKSLLEDIRQADISEMTLIFLHAATT